MRYLLVFFQMFLVWKLGLAVIANQFLFALLFSLEQIQHSFTPSLIGYNKCLGINE